jgi:hypothetical protein
MWIKKGKIFNEHHAQLPVVDTTYEDTYKIYYSTRDDKGRSIPMSIHVFKSDLKEYLSPQKINIELGKPGMFDHYGVMPTDIVALNKNTKYLYYIGWSLRKDIPYHNTLGLAISTDDGTTWKKYSEGPIFSTSSEEPGFIGTSKIIKEGRKWTMYYLSCREWIKNGEKIEPIYDIKIAVSKDGIRWNPTNEVAVPLLGNEGGISSFQSLGDKAWFSIRGKTNYRDNKEESYKIKTSNRVNGKWVRDEEIDLDVSEEGWDSEMVAYPFVIEEKNKLILFYNGNGFGKTGIGYATQETA